MTATPSTPITPTVPPTRRYLGPVMDSGRWRRLPLRAGDIIISTPAKCGTTWTQMICALLIFQSSALPRPLGELSPWVDMLTRPAEEIFASYEAQTHRRFFKTHTPLDGLPFDDRITYICVGRDPRDAALSWDRHARNTDLETMMRRCAAVAEAEGIRDELPPPPPDVPEPETAPERFWAWIDGLNPMVGLPATLRHLSDFWQVRAHPNVVLWHYDDLQADLAGRMRQLAEQLEIEIPADRWEELVAAATFEAMRQRADRLAPDPDLWRDTSGFFPRGRSGQWREILDADGLRRYAERVRASADPELVEWLHRDPLPAAR